MLVYNFQLPVFLSTFGFVLCSLFLRAFSYALVVCLYTIPTSQLCVDRRLLPPPLDVFLRASADVLKDARFVDKCSAALPKRPSLQLPRAFPLVASTRGIRSGDRVRARQEASRRASICASEGPRRSVCRGPRRNAICLVITSSSSPSSSFHLWFSSSLAIHQKRREIPGDEDETSSGVWTGEGGEREGQFMLSTARSLASPSLLDNLLWRGRTSVNSRGVLALPFCCQRELWTKDILSIVSKIY